MLAPPCLFCPPAYKDGCRIPNQSHGMTKWSVCHCPWPFLRVLWFCITLGFLAALCFYLESTLEDVSSKYAINLLHCISFWWRVCLKLGTLLVLLSQTSHWRGFQTRRLNSCRRCHLPHIRKIDCPLMENRLSTCRTHYRVQIGHRPTAHCKSLLHQRPLSKKYWYSPCF